MKIEREWVSARLHDGAFIHVRHWQVEGGQDMGGHLWFEARHARWVTEMLLACIETWAFPQHELQSGADHLKVFESGPEQSPVVNLRNRRAPGTEHGGVYVLMMSRSIAMQLVRSLRTLR